MEKKKIILMRIIIVLLICTTLLFAGMFFHVISDTEGNYSDEMKIPYTVNYDDEGANSVERKGDHQDSPYFAIADFYNNKPTETLSILPKFKTIQQTSWWSCGVCAVLMTLDYYDCLGNWNEKNLAKLCSDHSDKHIGLCLDQIIEMLQGASKLELETTYDYLDKLDTVDCAWIREQINNGYPIIVGWNDWGGHWQVIIGYDDMGTGNYFGDDVIIMADPFDTTDHNQDGYGVYGADRFIYNFDFYDFFGDEKHLHSKCFVVIKPKLT